MTRVESSETVETACIKTTCTCQNRPVEACLTNANKTCVQWKIMKINPSVYLTGSMLSAPHELVHLLIFNKCTCRFGSLLHEMLSQNIMVGKVSSDFRVSFGCLWKIIQHSSAFVNLCLWDTQRWDNIVTTSSQIMTRDILYVTCKMSWEIREKFFSSSVSGYNSTSMKRKYWNSTHKNQIFDNVFQQSQIHIEYQRPLFLWQLLLTRVWYVGIRCTLQSNTWLRHLSRSTKQKIISRQKQLI